MANHKPVQAEAHLDSWKSRWEQGYGAISHSAETRERIHKMAETLEQRGVRGDGVPFYELLCAADRIANAGMWLVVHQTYVRRVYSDGRALQHDDFKPNPEGHTGGSLNMVPAYAGYMTLNAITGVTRAWLMGQGHCVSAIDSVNLLLGNMTPEHARRYDLSDEGLTRFVEDFYLYRLGADGKPESPLGSHSNAYTAGAVMEGGYLGFAELQYIHMTKPDERLVAFLSDGAFEEQRGSDWAPRWWRTEDTGIVTPVMIANGRRIDQRTTLSQQGGVDWFVRHLELHNFDPIVFDGRDPAAFVWAIFEMETRLEAAGERIRRGDSTYPARLPYGIAVAPKGAGFYAEGTNLAHNLPLMANPYTDEVAAELFNASAKRLWVAPPELQEAAGKYQHHTRTSRPREADHVLTARNLTLHTIPEPEFQPVPQHRRNMADWTLTSGMAAVDGAFARTCEANPHIPARVGNPDEMKSNRMLKTLDLLRFRVTDPEPGVPEAIQGKVVTALNEEAVACAALANKAGINIIVTYEAFGTKMHGAVRQEITWADQLEEAGRKPRWLSVPLVLTSHTWENAKNEYSHQDPSMAETMLGETSNISRVLFPADHNTAAVLMENIFRTHGQIWTMVVPKSNVANLFTPEEARQLWEDGAVHLHWAGHEIESARILLVAIGSYQLAEVLQAAFRLAERGVPHKVIYMQEPGRFRRPRNDREAAHCAPADVQHALFPREIPARLFVTHTRPETMLGVMQPHNTGRQTSGLGYIVRGGTLNIRGLLFVNRSSWAHCVAETAGVLGMRREELLSAEEIEAIDGKRSPHEVIL